MQAIEKRFRELRAHEDMLFAQLHASPKDYEIVRIDRALLDTRRTMDKMRRQLAVARGL